ncbi:MAG TPA: lysophospholipid acyltransferase family protein [Planctomycetota bacterium]|nr:lysophospholipid acyltransferase family protein [Planctomycetota bacterium]
MRRLLEYGAYRALAFLVPFLPRTALAWIGHRLGALYYLASARDRRVGMENLRRVFPERDDHARMLRRSLKLQAVALLDALWAAKLHPERAARFVDADMRQVEEVRSRIAANGAGAVVATAHFGSWEMLNLSSRALGFPPATFIAREVRNPLIDRHLRRQRERGGNKLAYRAEALGACMAALRRGEVACSVIDISVLPEEGGLFVDFLGTPACTSAVLPLLAVRRSRLLYFLVCRPIDGGRRYRLEGEEIPIREDGDAEAEVFRLTRELNAALERAIRAHPEAWMWGYKRWKWRPSEMPGAYPTYSGWVTKHF